MIAFWIAAALLSAASAGLVIHRASRAAVRAAHQDEDPTLTVYRRQLHEVEDLAGRGLLTPEEFRSTRTEAARRLLSAADAAPKPGATGAGRAAVVTVAALAPLVALGLYLKIGSPGVPDQPFNRRVAEWRRADPAELDAERMVAVLQQVVAQKPGDVEALAYLGRAQAGAGDAFSAERTVQKALKLAPKRADLWTLYGQFMVAEQPEGDLPDDARNAFQTAVALDPHALAPRYFLGRARIASGDIDGGLADWKALRQDVPAGDPRSDGLAQEIATVERTRALPKTDLGGAPQAEAAAGADPRAFIHGMVARLAARLQASPDDPAGWARLVRSYGVLGDTVARDAALARARVLFKNRPNDLAPIEASAK
ncbi:MAG TPA: c-type cytochrome biogenesis protein CcmI [Caulobacteraceae bacterium]|jgi:cytochrome c-type biogenesis protein CcmH